MSILAKRAVLAALTVVGLALLVTGAWFTVHLGSSGSATFTASPARGSVVLVPPSVLNRVDRPVTVTAVSRGRAPVWIGRSTPSDATTIVGGADRTTITGARVRDWTLVQSRTGAGPAPALADADIWRQTATGKGRARLNVDQADAPETVVVATADGRPADLVSLTVTIERHTWFFQALLTTLVGLLATLAGGAALWQLRRREPAPSEGLDRPTAEVSA